MENTSYVALSSMTMLTRQMDVIANNMANANTASFKQQYMVVNEYDKNTTGTEKLTMVQDFAVLRDLRQGALVATDNPLDLAIDGNGYYVLETSSGPRYTRGGGFTLDSNGTIVNRSGNPLLDVRNRPIQIPATLSDIRITADGSITGTDSATRQTQNIAQVRLVKFDNPHYLKELGDGLYETEESPQAADKAQVRQFMQEESNVNPILTLTEMIDVQRRYQSTQNFLDKEDERQRDMLQRLGKASS
jgi:flagellar basal-body rod protein FlgF